MPSIKMPLRATLLAMVLALVQGEAERQLFDTLSGDDSIRLADILDKLDRARASL